jgi:hypothetical protein
MRLTAHLVNYNVPLGAGAPPPEPVKDIELRMPLPRGYKPVDLTVLDPRTHGAESLPWQWGDGAVFVKLPSLTVYAIVVLNLKQ